PEEREDEHRTVRELDLEDRARRHAAARARALDGGAHALARRAQEAEAAREEEPAAAREEEAGHAQERELDEPVGLPRTSREREAAQQERERRARAEQAQDERAGTARRRSSAREEREHARAPREVREADGEREREQERNRRRLVERTPQAHVEREQEAPDEQRAGRGGAPHAPQEARALRPVQALEAFVLGSEQLDLERAEHCGQREHDQRHDQPVSPVDP